MGLFDLFSNDSAEEAARLANEGQMKGLQQLANFYGQGRSAIDTNYGKAENILQGATDFFKGGAEAYGDVAGAHGVEGLQRATDLYRNSGQYGMFGVANDAAQQALSRQMSAGGRGDSGFGNYNAMKTANDLALGGWGQFQQGLLPYMSAYGGATQNQANLYPGWGNQLNASFMGQGNAANTTEGTIGKNLAGAELNNYNVGANQLNALMGIGQMAMGMPPSSFSKIGAPGSQGGGGGGNQFSGNWQGNPVQQTAQTLFSGFGNAGFPGGAFQYG